MLVRLLIYTAILLIRLFCHFVAWLTPDGNPFRRLAVGGLLLLVPVLVVFPLLPGTEKELAEKIGKPLPPIKVTVAPERESSPYGWLIEDAARREIEAENR